MDGARGGTAEAQPAAPAVDVSGLWMSQYNNGPLNRLNLTQAGVYVTGTYTSSASMPGAMVGRFTGLVLAGRWTDASSSGGFRLTFTPDGQRFNGTWGRVPSSENNGGSWVGHRQ